MSITKTLSCQSVTYTFTKFEVKEIKKKRKENTIPFWAQSTSKLEFRGTEAQKNQGRKN